MDPLLHIAYQTHIIASPLCRKATALAFAAHHGGLGCIEASFAAWPAQQQDHRSCTEPAPDFWPVLRHFRSARRPVPRGRWHLAGLRTLLATSPGLKSP